MKTPKYCPFCGAVHLVPVEDCLCGEWHQMCMLCRRQWCPIDGWVTKAGKPAKRFKGGKLLAECGATRTSLENALKLLNKYGVPYGITCEGDDFAMRTHVTWTSGVTHTFTGLGWGYSGEGPRGLCQFLKMVGMPMDMERIEAFTSWKPAFVLERELGKTHWVLTALDPNKSLSNLDTTYNGVLAKDLELHGIPYTVICTTKHSNKSVKVKWEDGHTVVIPDFWWGPTWSNVERGNQSALVQFLQAIGFEAPILSWGRNESYVLLLTGNRWHHRRL